MQGERGQNANIAFTGTPTTSRKIHVAYVMAMIDQLQHLTGFVLIKMTDIR